MKKSDTDKMYSDYAEGGLVSKNAMSDYFLASSGKMTEMEFVGKHKISTLNFENKFQEDNNVDIAGIESFSEINDKPKGVKMDYSKKPQTLNQGGEVDPVSGNDIPPGVEPENVRDDIPAMLSEGEYVVPADVLKFYGVSFFEKLRGKAKAGMAEMESTGRTGGEPVTMAEGGVVGSFDPRDYGTVGGTTGDDNFGLGEERALGSSAYESREYTGPNGESAQVLFVNGVQMGSVPEGYVPMGGAPAAPGVPSGVTPEVPGGMDEREAPVNYGLPTEGGDDTEAGFGLGNPLGELNFDDAESVESWASERLSGGLDNKGATVAGGAVAGTLGAGIGNAIAAARDIAMVNAASLAAEANGNNELRDSLKGKADERSKSMGIFDFVPESWTDGKSIFGGFNKSKPDTPAKTETKTSTPSAQRTDFDIEGVDSSIDRSGFDSSQKAAVTSSLRPQARPSRGNSDAGGSYSGTPDGEGGYSFGKGGLVTRPKKQPK